MDHCTHMHGCICLCGPIASCTPQNFHSVLHISQNFHSVLRTSLRYYAALRTSLRFHSVLHTSLRYYAVLRTSLRYYAVLRMQPNSFNSMFCRLREAELLFQADRVADSDRLLRTVVRKNPTYAGASHCIHYFLDITICLHILLFVLSHTSQFAQLLTHSTMCGSSPPHSVARSLTRSLTHSLTRSLTHSPTHPPPTHPPTCSPACLHTSIWDFFAGTFTFPVNSRVHILFGQPSVHAISTTAPFMHHQLSSPAAVHQC